MIITIKEARISSGLTQYQLAILVGVSKTTISNWERGKSCISAISFIKFCRITGVPVNDIFTPKVH